MTHSLGLCGTLVIKENMIKNGLKKNIVSHRDRSFIPSFGATAPVSFPLELNTDAGLWYPDQNQPNAVPFDLPALPEGCTDFTQAGLATDLSRALKDPLALEGLTHANQNGGTDIRTSLLAARSLGWIAGFYNIQSSGIIDAFDAMRIAILSGQPENRSVSWGTPWFPEWELACNPATNPSAIMPMPQDLNPKRASWHNSKISGWTTINGTPYLVDYSWQGNTVGKNGFVYYSREVVNAVMTIKGTVAYTGTLQTPPFIGTIDVTIVQWITSYIRQLLGL